MVNIIKNNKSKLKYFLNKFTNGTDQIYVNKLLGQNEGFKDTLWSTFINPFISGDIWNQLAAIGITISSIIIGICVYLISVSLYINLFYTPIDKGIVNNIEFKPSHIEIQNSMVYVGKTPISVNNTEEVPDTYIITVKSIDGEDTEKWLTTNLKYAEKLQKNDTIMWDQNLYDIKDTKYGK